MNALILHFLVEGAPVTALTARGERKRSTLMIRADGMATARAPAREPALHLGVICVSGHCQADPLFEMARYATDNVIADVTVGYADYCLAWLHKIPPTVRGNSPRSC